MKLATTTLIFCVTALLSLGMVMLYSSSMADPKTHYLQMQFIWCSAGLAGCGVAAGMDFRGLKKPALALFAPAVVLLGAAFMPHICHRGNGGRSWFQLGGTEILVQPSEVGEIAVIIAPGL